MENLENEIAIVDTNEIFPLKSTKKLPATPELSDLEAAIISRSGQLNLPALSSFFSVSEDVVKAALAKAPAQPCNC
jgi:hypothetical protein